MEEEPLELVRGPKFMVNTRLLRFDSVIKKSSQINLLIVCPIQIFTGFAIED